MSILVRMIWKFVKSALALGACLLVVIPAWAAFDDDDDLPAMKSSSRQEQKKRKAYAGARDEQDLKVQPSLPQPSRFPDGTSGGPTTGEQSRGPVDTD